MYQIINVMRRTEECSRRKTYPELGPNVLRHVDVRPAVNGPVIRDQGEVLQRLGWPHSTPTYVHKAWKVAPQ